MKFNVIILVAFIVALFFLAQGHTTVVNTIFTRSRKSQTGFNSIKYNPVYQ